MLTLVIDTSSRFTTVVLTRDDRAIASVSLEIQPLSHLHAMIHEVLGRVGIALDAIGRLAVVTGPGSWTGLNIGVTVAKTLAQVLALPLVELPSLHALVAAQRWLGGPIYGILDAKRGNVYCGAYATDAQGQVQLSGSELEIRSFDDFATSLGAAEGQPLVIEYGAVYRPRIERDFPRVCITSRQRLSDAGLVATLNARGGQALEGNSILALSPLYLQRALGA